jgi:hypothetical protein
MRSILIGLVAGLSLLALAPAASAFEVDGVKCETPPVFHCDGATCNSAVILEQGNAIEPKTGRKFFLDYPCDLKPGEKVVFILSLHGAGSIANWQRHYFPAMDYKEKYRLVIATPQAASTASIFPGMPPIRMWQADADDQYLHNIVDQVYALFGKERIRSFWLAGHSQGGMTSNRIVCTDFFANKVDGWLSLSGGRIGRAEIPASFFVRPGTPPGSPPPSFPKDGPRPGTAATPTCDFNYIFESGQNEIVALPTTSPWAAKYACAARRELPDVVDTTPGHVYDTTRQNPPNPAWGTTARPGTAKVYVYPSCQGGKLVADVERLDKGHTEGLEPNVTETLLKMIVAAPAPKNGS